MTAAQMREVDRIMVDQLHIGLIQMMENAGYHLADLGSASRPAETAAAGWSQRAT